MENLNEIGVTPFVVGTKDADVLEIQFISQDASQAFLAPDFNDVSSIEQELISNIKTTGSLGGAHKPSLHGKPLNA